MGTSLTDMALIGGMPDVTEAEAGWPGLPAELYEAHWYAAYTIANHERCVVDQLRLRRVEHFLPLYTSIRRWKDRRVALELPLFRGYVFVHLCLRDRLRILQIPNVVRIVGFNGRPYAVPDTEINALRNLVHTRLRFKPHPYLTRGCRVRVRHGSLCGTEGILLRQKNVSRVVISVNLISSSVAVDIDACDLERID